MRLGLLGPAPDHQDDLARAARWLASGRRADRVLYLGSDRMLDTVVSAWAEELVGQSADDASIMVRATRACLTAEAEEIDAFLIRERKRNALRMFECLPGELTRSVDLIGGRVAVMLYDKAHLEEDDILPATLLIFGKNRKPLVKRIGRRWFLSPGTFPHYGLMIIDDAEDKLRALTYDKEFTLVDSQELDAPKALVMRATGVGP